MRTEPAKVGVIGVDSLPFSQSGTQAQADALADAGMSFVEGYLGVITPARVEYVLKAGMAFMPVTLAGRYDGAEAVAQLRALGLSPGVTTCLDVEGLAAFHTDPKLLAAKVNAWADAVACAGFEPGGYFGSPQPFTSDELWQLHVRRYWRGQGSIRDRKNELAEPTKCGWCVTQAYPSVVRGGVLVDVDMIGEDYLRRVPSWAVAD